MKKYVIGLDNGGTVSKAALFDIEGHELAVAGRQTPIYTPKPGYNERDMDYLWQVNCECVREVITKSDVYPGDIIGIAVGGHGKGLYLWGKDDRPAYYGIVSTDNRAWQYPEEWRSSGIFDELYPQLCQQLLPSQQVSLLAWMKDHERNVYDQIKWIFSVKDYIRFRLTGEAYCEVTDISGSGLFDVRNSCFDREMLEKLGIGEVYDLLAPLRYSSDCCGMVTAEAAQLTGLQEGTPVAGGMFDIDACAIAMNITLPEQLCMITGTWSINEFIATEPILGTSITMNSLYAIPGYYLIEESSATGAGNLEWFLQNCVNGDMIHQGENIYNYIEKSIISIAPEDCEIYYLPFLYGSNAHPLAKGSFVGLTTYHNRGHMLRAIYEGVAFSHKIHIEKLLRVRKAPSFIRMAGGAAKSRLWVQIFADILGLPIETVSGVKELGALGCAISATIAAGVYTDYTEAARNMVRVNPPIMPDQARSEIYKRKYAKYKAVMAALDNIWNQFIV